MSRPSFWRAYFFRYSSSAGTPQSNDSRWCRGLSGSTVQGNGLTTSLPVSADRGLEGRGRLLVGLEDFEEPLHVPTGEIDRLTFGDHLAGLLKEGRERKCRNRTA